MVYLFNHLPAKQMYLQYLSTKNINLSMSIHTRKIVVNKLFLTDLFPIIILLFAPYSRYSKEGNTCIK